MLTERWLVSVGAGRWQTSGILAARKAGLRVFAVDGDAAACGFSIADNSALVDIRDPVAVIDIIRKSEIKPSGAIAFVTEAGMRTAALIRQEFRLPGPGLSLTMKLSDKRHQRKTWSDAGLPCPRWFGADSPEEAAEAIRDIQGTCIIKPADSAGSRGVQVLETEEPWQTALAAALAASPTKRAIIEQFVIGTEFTVETFAHKGKNWVLAVSEKRKVPGTHDTVAIELATSALPAAEVERIGRLACDALDALGHTDGPGHTEILRDEDERLWLVETAGRGGGFMVADGIVPRASGFDLGRACALQAVGLVPPLPSDLPRQAFVLRFVPSRPGIVKRISGLETIKEIGNVDCGSLVAVGDEVGVARTDSARLAYILSWAADRTTAFALADRAEACIDIVIEAS